MQDTRIGWVIVAVAVIIAGASLMAMVSHGARKNSAVTITGTAPQQTIESPAPRDKSIRAKTVSPPASIDDNLIYVHVTGAVRNPNVYRLAPGSRVIHAIKAAGGAKNDADLDALNLAERMSDGDKLYVPSKGRAKRVVKDRPALERAVVNERHAIENIYPLPIITHARQLNVAPERETRSPGNSASEKKKMSGGEARIDINTATKEELERLPGVGPATAAKIIAYRQQSGGFKKPEDLMEVGGIGEKRMSKLAPYITIGK